MDERLLELWGRLLDPGDNPLSDEELTELREGVESRVATVDMASLSEEDLEVLSEAAEMHDQIVAVEEAREAEAATRQARAAEYLARMETQAPDAPAPAEGEAPAEGQPPAEGEAQGEGDQPPPAEGETAAGAPRVPAISHLAARQAAPRRATATEATAAERRPALLASADLPGLSPGQTVDLDQWAAASARRIEAVLQATGGNQGEKIYLGKLDRKDLYSEARTLDGRGPENLAKIDDVLTRTEPLAAAGGVCGPVAADYNVSSIASADRPVQAGMMNFGATRGGVRFILPHTLADVTALAPSQVWTQATDAAPGGSTKAHATFACKVPTEVYVDAVTSIVQFGNFAARYFPEQIQQFMDTVDAVHSRVAEATLLAAMVSGSVAVNAGNNGTNQTGAATELLAELDRASEHARYVNRIANTDRLQFWMPEYLEGMMRADVAREIPGATIDERLAIADAQINSWFDARLIDRVLYKDSPTGFAVLQGWTAQAAGDLQGWPTKALTFLTHPGAWTFLDGGELNLGMVRDSVLNLTNDFQMFSETFEKAVFRGHFSWAMTLDLCAFGGRAGTVDTTALCTTGS